jgi:ABC-type branched-subunit amino acid transport system ATPase component
MAISRVETIIFFRRYAGFTAVDDLSPRSEGRPVTLFGPSGRGKTTTLRMAASRGGDIWFGDQRMNNVPPHRKPPCFNLCAFRHDGCGKCGVNLACKNSVDERTPG